jgi:hypothetical protein
MDDSLQGLFHRWARAAADYPIDVSFGGSAVCKYYDVLLVRANFVLKL